MTTDRNFKDDLETGLAWEAKYLDSIREKYPQAYRVEGKFKGYDIYVPETEMAIEVKYDAESVNTGNIVIEVEMNGKPSGLTTTRADFWLVATPHDYCYISASRLMRLILRHGIRQVEFTGPGDSSSKKAYLVKKDLIHRYAHKVYQGIS